MKIYFVTVLININFHQVPPGSQRSVGQHIYAVMANPEILKHVGRNCEDPEVSAIRNLYNTRSKMLHTVGTRGLFNLILSKSIMLRNVCQVESKNTGDEKKPCV